jgi:hypothetical protein
VEVEMAFIYGLCEPGTKNVRYVGRSSNPEKRLEQHMSQALRYDRSEKSVWLRTLIERGEKPALLLVEEMSEDDYPPFRELFWIRYFLRRGHMLTNRSGGGVALSVKIDKALKNRLQAEARRRGTTLSLTVSILLEDALSHLGGNNGPDD